MVKKGKLSRRSFLGRVAGAAIATGATGVITGAATAQRYTGSTDSDTGSGADQAGYGRTGATDSDSGSNSDRAGYGRGSSGITDSDSGSSSDPVGNGRGSSSDRAGSGRGCTDSDTGGNSDPGGRGRRCSDSD